MKKQSLNEFIEKYSLGGEIESVKLQSSTDKLSVKFISDDKTLLGMVNATEIEFPVGEFGVYTTSQLKSLLNVLEPTVDVVSETAFIKFSDKATSVNYMLADLSVIPAVPELKQLPEFNVEMNIDDEFISKFIKAKGALNSIDTFTFVCKDGKGEIVLGYSTINTNRISLKVPCVCSGDVTPISFSAKYLKEILNANRNSKSATMKIASAGLCKLTFQTDTIDTEYFLVELK